MRPIYNNIDSTSINDKVAVPTFEVSTYSEISFLISRISVANPQHDIFFRGQHREYLDFENNISLYPSIYRIPSIEKLDGYFHYPYSRLRLAESLLMGYLFRILFDGKENVKNHSIVRHAILQHYEVCSTPLLDVTHSLRVACSFALNDNTSQEGILYLIGIPYQNSAITYSLEERVLCIKLASICPPDVLRPHFQEAYLIGDFPQCNEYLVPYEYQCTKEDGITSEKEDLAIEENGLDCSMEEKLFNIRKYRYINNFREKNFARRLIAKIILKKERFWDSEYQAISQKALFPECNDSFKNICDEIIKYFPEKETRSQISLEIDSND